MSGFLDNAEIEIPCGACGRKTKKTIGWVNTHSQFTCACGTVTKLKTDQFKAGIAKGNAAIKSLQDAVKRIGKKR